MSERPSFPCLIVLNASIIRARQEVAYAQANWSRTRDRHACSAIDSRGPEERAVAIVLVPILGEKPLIEINHHFDETAEVVNSEEINSRQAERKRQDQAQHLR